VVSDAPVAIEDVYPTLLEMAGIPVPDAVEGRSLLAFRSGKPSDWREYVHGEHCGWNSGRQFLTDGREKYIWKTVTGKEYLFDLENDPQELHDLAPLPEHAARLERWRQRMIAHLATRDDGMSDGKQLIPGKDLPAVRDFLL
jgi:arylsulfatase